MDFDLGDSQPRIHQPHPLTRVHLDTGLEYVIPTHAVFDFLDGNGFHGNEILARSIAPSRVQDALRAGTDRGVESRVTWGLGESEIRAMQKAGVTDPSDVLHAVLVIRDRPTITIDPDVSMLVYDRSRFRRLYEAESPLFHFVARDNPGLLAVVEHRIINGQRNGLTITSVPSK